MAVANSCGACPKAIRVPVEFEELRGGTTLLVLFGEICADVSICRSKSVLYGVLSVVRNIFSLIFSPSVLALSPPQETKKERERERDKEELGSQHSPNNYRLEKKYHKKIYLKPTTW